LKTTILATRSLASALACFSCAASVHAASVHAADPLIGDALAWLDEQKVTASDGNANSYFGSAVSIEGGTAAIGADGDANFKGAVYMFKDTGGIWSEGQKIAAADGAGGEQFGYRTALEGNTLVVGAFSATVDGNAAQGAAYVFTNGGTWSQTAKLIADDGGVFENFGAAVALDGETVVIGANGAFVNDVPQGAAYVFTGSGASWTQRQKLVADDGTDYDNFGMTTAVKGGVAFVGSPLAPVDGNNGAGAVYLYTESGGTWTQTQRITASDGAANDSFGMGLAFDGTTLIVGATSNEGIGAAYVFTESGGTWTEAQKLVPDDGASGDSFGNAISISGSRVLIGADIATIDGDTSRGAVYLFTNSGIAGDGTTDDFFGAALALDGKTALIGTPHPTIDGNTWQGAAYFFVDDAIFGDGFDGTPL
jgi:hypothetical protein